MFVFRLIASRGMGPVFPQGLGSTVVEFRLHVGSRVWPHRVVAHAAGNGNGSCSLSYSLCLAQQDIRGWNPHPTWQTSGMGQGFCQGLGSPVAVFRLRGGSRV